MKTLLRYLTITSVIFIFNACSDKETVEILPEPPAVELEIDPSVAFLWAEMSLDVIKNTESNSPTYASRSLGYLGLSMYEAAVQGSIEFQSVAASVNGLGEMPKALDSLTYDWELSVNAAQSVVLKGLYPHATSTYKEKIDSLNQAFISTKRNAMVSEDVLKRSADFGISIANKILLWAQQDGGHKGYERTFDSEYQLPRGLYMWQPPRFGQSSIPLPMHPYWGQNRTFVKANSDLPIPEIIPFSQDPESDYFKEMQEVFLVQSNLDQTARENALWWGDDPAVSVSPPGHSYFLAAKIAKQENIKLFEVTSTFAKVGMSVADAFINCFKCKYFYHTERPTAYIRRNFTVAYNQFWPEPPFPGFTSGHSTQAAAAATAMISIFGDDITFTDDLHEGREKDFLRNVEFKSRSFTSIWSMAEQCGYSRIEGGIHTPQDNVVGLEEGKSIASNINSLPWKVEGI